MILLSSLISSHHRCFVRLISAPRWAPKCYCKRLVSSNKQQCLRSALAGCWYRSLPCDLGWFRILQMPTIPGGGPAYTPTLKSDRSELYRIKWGKVTLPYLLESHSLLFEWAFERLDWRPILTMKSSRQWLTRESHVFVDHNRIVNTYLAKLCQ